MFLCICIYIYTCNTPPAPAHTDIFELKCFLPAFLNSKYLKRSAFNLSEFLVTVFQQKRSSVMDNLSFQSPCQKYFNLRNYYIPFNFINLFIHICKEPIDDPGLHYTRSFTNMNWIWNQLEAQFQHVGQLLISGVPDNIATFSSTIATHLYFGNGIQKKLSLHVRP